MYIYKTEIFHDTTGVIGVPASNATDLADFDDALKKGKALEVTELVISETDFILFKDYAAFDALINGSPGWGSVRYIAHHKSYEIFICNENPIV